MGLQLEVYNNKRKKMIKKFISFMLLLLLISCLGMNKNQIELIVDNSNLVYLDSHITQEYLKDFFASDTLMTRKKMQLSKRRISEFDRLISSFKSFEKDEKLEYDFIYYKYAIILRNDTIFTNANCNFVNFRNITFPTNSEEIKNVIEFIISSD